MSRLLSGLFQRRGAPEPAQPLPQPSRGEGTDVDPIDQALADREAELTAHDGGEATRSAAPTDISPEVAAALAARVSPEAYALIVRHETGGRDYYEGVYKARPVWPGASSGITIGFGYDLGYQNSTEAFAADWSPVLPGEHVELLKAAVGLSATGADRLERVARIKAILAELIAAGVRIPWEPSEAVFKATTVPRFAALTASRLPGHEALSPDCFGAIVSLTFNRGASFDRQHDPAKDKLDRFREMRAIKAAVGAGELDRVPALLRAMKRLWRGTDVEGELTRRRENEARLFEEGLVPLTVAHLEAAGEQRRAEQRQRALTRGATRQIRGIVEHDVADEFAEETQLEELRRGTDFATEATRAASKVSWAADDEHPDYAHLQSKLGAGVRFSLRAADLAYLAAVNDFPVAEAGDKPVLFGLRGCAIVEASEDELDDEVLLRDQRPDHKSTRCVIGVWDRAAGRIAVFPASTVPNSEFVTSWYKNQDSGNMLPTGFYRYIVGPHNYRPGCWLLRETISRKHTVLVRRSSDDLAYDSWDDVSKSQPGDNLHPTFSMGQGWYSSAGCQVVVGQADKHSGNHRGPWAKFRRLAGLKTVAGKEGERYVYMLLTGHEAMLAARAREEGATEIPEVRQSLMRLRFGSNGARVARLQTALGMEPTGNFDVPTGSRLHELQQTRNEDASDGIFTPAFDQQLNAGVFFEPAPAVPPIAAAPETPETGSTPGPTPGTAPAPVAQPAAAGQPGPAAQPPPGAQPDPQTAAAPVAASGSNQTTAGG